MNPNESSSSQPTSTLYQSGMHEPIVPINEPQTMPSGQNQNIKDIVSIALVLISALILAFGLITFVFQSYQVDGPSMQTTLHNNDHLIVWKVARTWARITHHSFIPKRGDIVIFSEPGLADFGQSSDKQLIKRVIGLPGDRVVVKDDIITVYNKANPNGFQPDKTLPYGKVILTTQGNIDITLSSGEIFVCGDNRSNSLDSRVFGPVNVNNIIGKLVLRVLPISDAQRF